MPVSTAFKKFSTPTSPITPLKTPPQKQKHISKRVKFLGVGQLAFVIKLCFYILREVLQIALYVLCCFICSVKSIQHHIPCARVLHEGLIPQYKDISAVISVTNCPWNGNHRGDLVFCITIYLRPRAVVLVIRHIRKNLARDQIIVLKFINVANREAVSNFCPIGACHKVSIIILMVNSRRISPAGVIKLG